MRQSRTPKLQQLLEQTRQSIRDYHLSQQATQFRKAAIQAMLGSLSTQTMAGALLYAGGMSFASVGGAGLLLSLSVVALPLRRQLLKRELRQRVKAVHRNVDQLLRQHLDLAVKQVTQDLEAVLQPYVYVSMCILNGCDEMEF